MKSTSSLLSMSCMALLLTAAAALPDLHAQQRPLTGNMLNEQAANTPAPAPVTPVQSATAQAAPAPATPAVATPAATQTPSDSTPIGQTTRDLLRLQASGAQAGKRLPILGDQASASYARYLKSFEHPIPVFFEATVEKSESN